MLLCALDELGLVSVVASVLLTFCEQSWHHSSKLPQAPHSVFQENPSVGRHAERGWRRQLPHVWSERNTQAGSWARHPPDGGEHQANKVKHNPNKPYQASEPEDGLEAHFLQPQPRFEEVPLYWCLTEVFHLAFHSVTAEILIL